MNNQFHNRSYNIRIISNLSYIVKSVNVIPIFLTEKGKERQTDKEKQTDRETDRQRKTNADRQIEEDIQTKRDRDKQTKRDRDRQQGRERETQTNRERDTEEERKREGGQIHTQKTRGGNREAEIFYIKSLAKRSKGNIAAKHQSSNHES